MADIISIDERLKLGKEKKAAIIRAQKIQSLRKILQCTHCAHKCAKCGTQIGVSDEDQRNRLPYRLCESCAEEHLEYVQRLQKKKDPAFYWYNDAWMEVWTRWIAYQESVRGYQQSKEFTDLMKEFEQPGGKD